MGKISAGGNVVVASTVGEIGRSIGAGDKRTSPSGVGGLRKGSLLYLQSKANGLAAALQFVTDFAQ